MPWALQVLPCSRRYDAKRRKGLERGQYAWHGICYLVVVSLGRGRWCGALACVGAACGER